MKDVYQVQLAPRHALRDARRLIERRPVGVGEIEPDDHG
jgi:hypothetical protein